MNLADHGTTGARPEAAPTAANDDHHAANLPAVPTAAQLVGSLPSVSTAPADAPAADAAGWDAFEIWRSRVRDPRRDARRAYRD